MTTVQTVQLYSLYLICIDYLRKMNGLTEDFGTEDVTADVLTQLYDCECCQNWRVRSFSNKTSLLSTLLLVPSETQVGGPVCLCLCPHMSYENAIRKLYSANLHQRVKMGLLNIEKLMLTMGSGWAVGPPSSALKLKRPVIVHVAGTNGKGSVCWKMSKALQSSGLKTGLFVSPHISCFRERVQVNGKYISPQETVNLLDDIFDATKTHEIPATFFEMTTALALKHFEQEQCEAIVMEVGLGGKLDATNILYPDVSVITSISLDHVKILGDTIEEIAVEKGGIIKDAAPVVVGPNCPLHVFMELSEEKNATLHALQRNGYDEFDFCKENEMLARKAYDILLEANKIPPPLSDASFEAAMSSLPPCRFALVEREGTGLPPKALLDIAHNPGAIKALFKRLKSMGATNPTRAVVGFSQDKDVATCCDEILQNTTLDRVYVVQASHQRAMEGRVLFNQMLEAYERMPPTMREDSQLSLFKDRYSDVSDCSLFAVEAGIKQALDDVELEESTDAIVFCGSAYGMNEAMKALDVPQLESDSEVVQELWDTRKHGLKGDDGATEAEPGDDMGHAGSMVDPSCQKVEKRSTWKTLARKYGPVALAFHSVVYCASLGCSYYIVSNGFDPAAYIDIQSIPPEAGTLAIAWSLNACVTSVPRAALTAVAAPVLGNMLSPSSKNSRP